MTSEVWSGEALSTTSTSYVKRPPVSKAYKLASACRRLSALLWVQTTTVISGGDGTRLSFCCAARAEGQVQHLAGHQQRNEVDTHEAGFAVGIDESEDHHAEQERVIPVAGQKGSAGRRKQ